ncbi:cytochrome P450 [Pedosphaera parvula]|uniref:Cytochrome P450 n=1 Tax=Pedosphaera parvula (strain Ellin514) TaxID=320771 RepID=B9XGH6_PEDPL|nr:cytochrome P450 [Pedosphaera parvula]EEF61027.1 cytochrome P450 [Pedosphaera parvula Ellin514]
MKNAAKVPGPSRLQLLRDYPKVRRDLTRYLVELYQQHGETVLLPLIYPTYMVSNPADIKYILVSNPTNYHKTGGLRIGKELFGEGLVTSEVPLHTRQRRLMQPMFHRQSIANFADIMTNTTHGWIKNWKEDATINIGMELMQLTLSIVGKALFSIDLVAEAQEIGNAFITAQVEITRIQRGLPLPKFIRTPSHRRYEQARKTIDGFIHDLINKRRRDTNPPDDLLTLLLASRYEDGSPMSEQQIRDEAVTILMAGHETVTNGLSWTFYLLARHPEIQARVLKEIETVLGRRLPTMADLPSFKYTEMVLAEAFRIFPPAWILARRVLKEDNLPSGLTLPEGSEVILVQFVCHRNERYFPDPEQFNPERFNPEVKKEWPQFAYFPFGAGPRFCIGESFARMEAILLITTILQQFNLELVPGQDIVPEPLITLRPRNGILLKLTRHERQNL